MVVRFWRSHSLLGMFFLANISVSWAFVSGLVGHGQSIKYFRNCRPWYPVSWTVFLNQKWLLQFSWNWFEPLFYLWHDIF